MFFGSYDEGCFNIGSDDFNVNGKWCKCDFESFGIWCCRFYGEVEIGGCLRYEWLCLYYYLES